MFKSAGGTSARVVHGQVQRHLKGNPIKSNVNWLLTEADTLGV